MSLVSKRGDVPSFSTSSEIYMCPIDDGLISIADWIGFKRTIWGRLPLISPHIVSSQSGSIRSRSSLVRSPSRATPQLIIRSLCDRVAKTDGVIVILKESLVWKSMSDCY